MKVDCFVCAEVTAEVQPQELTPAAPAEVTGAPEAPRFIQTLQRQLDVYQGTTVTLVCTVVGQPRPVITWYRVCIVFLYFPFKELP